MTAVKGRRSRSDRDLVEASTDPDRTDARLDPAATATPQRRLGDVVVDLGFADRGIVEATVALAREDGRPIGQALVEGNVIDPHQLAQALAARNGLDYVDLSSFEVDHGAANMISSAEARRYRAIPIAFVGDDMLLVATADPANLFGLDGIAIATERKVRPMVTTPEDLEALIGQLSRLIDSVDEVDMATEDEEDREPEIELRESADEAPVVKLVHTLIADAVNRGTSDIHLDPSGGDLRVRFRVDGVVVDSATVPKRLATGLI